jgi:hypothetical protein
MFSGFLGTIRALRLPAACPDSLHWFARRYHCCVRLRSRSAERMPDGPGVVHPVPHRELAMEAAGPPTFLDVPHADLPRSPTPAESPRLRSLMTVTMLPPNLKQRRLPRFQPFRGSITRLFGSLSTLRSKGYPKTTQDSLPVVRPTLPDRVGCLLGRDERFSELCPLPNFVAQLRAVENGGGGRSKMVALGW